MRKNIFFIITSFVLIILLCACNTNTGKDTAKIYNNGVYHIFNHRDDDGNLIKGFTDNRYNQCIVDNIINMKETSDYLYIYGEYTGYKMYVVIDLTSNTTKCFANIGPEDILCIIKMDEMIKAGDFDLLNSYDDFTQDEKNQFNNLINE